MEGSVSFKNCFTHSLTNRVSIMFTLSVLCQANAPDAMSLQRERTFYEDPRHGAKSAPANTRAARPLHSHSQRAQQSQSQRIKPQVNLTTRNKSCVN